MNSDRVKELMVIKNVNFVVGLFEEEKIAVALPIMGDLHRSFLKQEY